ncbi:MAG: cobalt ECF transporter T component CbiQ [Chloroflexi bacterium]|nr:cobalt ECF transporter T component CbiQ [Chloroflexota bacterium]
MKHDFIDKYSNLDSFIHRLDPRTKFLTSLALTIAVVLTPAGNWKVFLCYFLILAVLILFSRLPLLYVMKRSLVIIPFVLMVAIFIPFFKQGQIAVSYNSGLFQLSITYDGILILTGILIKSWLCILSLVLLTSCTKLADMLEGLKQLGVPHVFILILSFMYRYIFVLADQAMRMQQARDSRNFGGNYWHKFKIIGNMIGTLFIRSYERGERVYVAMLARGYNGEVSAIRKLHYAPADAYFSLLLFILLLCPPLLWW